MNQYRQQVVSGMGWSVISQAGEQLLAFIISIVLARLLTPQDFGLVGMMIVFTGFAQMFSELGLGSALVQRRDLDETTYSSIFWLNLGAGLLVMCVVILAAPWIADFYGEPKLVPLTMLVSVNFLLGALNIVQRALLLRVLNFRVLAIIQISVTLLAGSVAIVLAYLGYGPYALAWQALIVTAATVVIMWIMSEWRPRMIFDRQAVAELWGYSSNLLGANILNYWVRNADNLLIGRYIGAAALGIYTRAYSTMLLPINQVTSVLGRVMFPAMSMIQEDKAKVKSIYLKAISYIALITFPMMLGLLVVARPFVLSLYGPQWEAVVPVLQVLSLIGLVQSLAASVGWIYMSQGRTDWQFRWVLAGGILTFIAFGIGVQWGVMGVAIAYAVRVYGTLYWNFMIPGKLIDMRVGEVANVVAGAFLCAVVMALCVWFMGLIVPAAWSSLARLILQAGVGAGVYATLIHICKLKSYLDIRQLLVEQWGRRRHKLQPSREPLA